MNTALASGCLSIARLTLENVTPLAIPNSVSKSGFTKTGIAPDKIRALMTDL